MTVVPDSKIISRKLNYDGRRKNKHNVMETAVGNAKPRILLTGLPGTRHNHFAFLL
jgi:hypothetical protein